MASVKYFVRSSKKKDSEVSIYARMRSGKIDLGVCTGVTVPFELWNDKQGDLKYYQNKDSQTILRMNKAKADLETIKGLLYNLMDTDPTLKAKDAANEIKKHFDEANAVKSAAPKDMNKYIAYLIGQMKSGERKVKGKNYSEGSIKSWNSFAKTWKTFQNDYLNRMLDFKNITMSIHSKFVSYCYSREYTADTTRKYLTTLIAVMNYALKDGISENRIHETREFSKTVPIAEGKKPYLTEAEIEAIFNLELNDPMLQKVRDVFLIGCYCGQRVSDFSRITKDNIITLPNGYKAFNITQQKTGTRVIVPFLSKNITTILERWDYELPYVIDVLINRHIKTICEKAKITEPFLTEIMRGGKLEKTYVSKCDLITCHTARRSCITNLYNKNLLDIHELRAISGHKTNAAFEKYICLSNDEKAMRIAEKLGAF
ncbi:tyrosine-type recombinase/integrase [Prevotella sp. 10(H)]|uniref:tyrosine-type recombinase/integrase n=1 Tax=Prevotella sp. 10(H) TaxID=1158294 RepID=UPI0004A6D5EB|nr:tyrosine-type recombinase/integrase [Prevotella sp. 10(H)]